jgi:hypothetical protein
MNQQATVPFIIECDIFPIKRLESTGSAKTLQEYF